VSISSPQSNNWLPPYLPQTSQTSVAAPLTGSSPQTSTSTNPFQQLATDVQAVLAQGQSATNSPATSSTTTDPTQQLATDLQSIYAQLQASQSGGEPGEQTPTTGQANATGSTHHHHRESHANSSSGTASTSPTSSPGNTSQALTADMMRALQAYASSSSATSSIGLTI
jgi:hypothetical protein